MKQQILPVSLWMLLLLSTSFQEPNTVKFCSRNFVEQKTKEFLKDEGIYTTGITVLDPKTKKPVFGYIKSALRNDTNFIYTRFSSGGDTIIRKMYFDHKISQGRDSVVTTYLCLKKGLVMHRQLQYWNGKKVQDTLLNVLVYRY